MKKLIVPFLFVLLPVAALATDLAFTLMPPAHPVPAGSNIRIDLAGMNPGALDVPFVTPISLAARLVTPSDAREVTLDAETAAPVYVAPGMFAVRRYHVILPSGVSGRAVLEIDTPALGVLRAVVDVEAPSVAAEPVRKPGEVIPTRLEELHNSVPVALTLTRTFAGRFMPNQPVYFIYGNEPQAVKFQISFDYRLASYRWGKPGADKISTLRVGYTQRSLWDIKGDSSPFYDSSYMPELAFNTDSVVPKQRSWFTWMGWRTGFLHESNGKDGADSRSMNTFYIRPRFVLGDVDHWFAVMVPEIQAYIGDIGNNPTIKDYRGYGKLRFYFGRNDGPTLRVSAWSGKSFDHGTYELELAWPIRTKRLGVESYFHVQYFKGYGESLRSYDQKTDALRFGIGLVR